MTVSWGLMGIGAIHGSIGSYVLWRVGKSLRTGVNDWTDFGTVKRARHEYDFWTVNLLFGVLGLIFTGAALFTIFQAFQ